MDEVEISAGRLHLRPWTPYDEDALVAIYSDPEVVRWTPAPVPFTHEEARRRLTEVYPELWRSGAGTPFAVLGSTTGEVLAWVSLFDVAQGRAEIGWACLPAARGDAVTTDAVQALCRWGFGFLGLEVVQATIAVGNWASRAVAEKSGFTVEGLRRREMPQRGQRLDAWTTSLLASDPITDRRPLRPPAALTDGVLALRPFRPEDAADVARACDDPVSAFWLPGLPSPYTLEHARTYVAEVAPTAWADGREAMFVVTDARTGELLGDCGLKLHHRSLGYGEIGYWTAPWARGRGVASRATALVARWGLEELGLNRVEIVADVANTASVRAAEKAGFVREGIARRARPDRDGAGCDMVLLSLVRDDLTADHAG